jgi:putative membrane protein
MVILSPDAHAAVRQAIEACEQGTAGEIYCVIAPEASDYGETPVVLAALAAFLVPVLLLVFSAGREGWTIAHIGAGRDVVSLSTLIAIQAAAFSLVWLVASIRTVRVFLTPAPLKRERVRQRTLEQFHAHNLHQTEGRTGVLIFVSLAEHMAELLADEGVNRLVSTRNWQRPMDALISAMKSGDLAGGLIASVNEIGAILAAHVPARITDINELSDAVIELPGH